MAKKRKTTKGRKSSKKNQSPQHMLPAGFWAQVGAVILIAVSVSAVTVTPSGSSLLLPRLLSVTAGYQTTTLDVIGVKKPAEPWAVRVF